MNTRLIALSLAGALAGCAIIANRGFAQEYESQELGDLESRVEGLEIEQMNCDWDAADREHQRKMQEIQAETDRNLEAIKDSQKLKLLALKLTVDQIRARQPAAKSALLHFINGFAAVSREMDKPEAVRSVQVVREGLRENQQGMKELRDLAITPLPTEDRTIMLVCYGESKPKARDRELKNLISRLRHPRWRFEKREFWRLSADGAVGIWIVRGKIYL